MTSTLKPIEAVMCPSIKRLVAVKDCEKCECVIEVRRPWRHFAVKCNIGEKHEAIYP